MPNAATLPTDAAPLLPHQPPIRMLTRLLACGNGTARAEACVKMDHPLVDSSGKLERAALIEIMAQTYAAARSYEKNLPAGGRNSGFMVGLSELRILSETSAGQILAVEATTEIALDNFYVVRATVSSDAEVIADGCLKFWIDSDA